MGQQYQVQRSEKRVVKEVTLLLAGNHRMMGVEKAFTENVSSHGARVISTRHWLPGETLLVASLAVHFTSVARVAYCDPLGEGRFRAGLEFLEPSDNWVVSALATAQESTQT
jgi:PilZ domain-containing protein